MNNSKRVLREGDTVKKAKKRTSSGSLLPKIFISLGVLLVIGMIGIIGYESFHQDPLVTIDGTDYRLRDIEIMYQMYQQETTMEQTDQAYQAYGLGSYWDGADSNGVAYADTAKEGAVQNMVANELLYRKAIQEGYELTDDDKEKAQDELDSMKKMSSYRWRKTGFSEDTLLELLQHNKIASRYYDALIESYKITEDTVKDDVNKEDYKERKYSYITVSTKTTNENNETVEVENKDKLKTKMDEYLKKALAGDDFAKLVSKDDSNFTYKADATFIVGKDAVDEAVETAALTLKDGEVYDGVIETDSAYYIIKMIDTDCTDSYDSAIKSAVSSAQTEEYKKDYDKLETEYNVEYHDDAISKLKFGTLTLRKGDELEEFATEEPSATPTSTGDEKATATPEATATSK